MHSWEVASDCRIAGLSFLRPWKERKSDCSEEEKLLYPWQEYKCAQIQADKVHSYFS
jgi:hypothetical protein